MKVEPNRWTSNIICALALSFAVAAWPATNTVTSSASGGVGSLPEVIAASMAGDTIVFAITGSIPLTRELSVDKSLTIAGPGASVLAITGSGENRIFNITASATVYVSGLTLCNGQAGTGAHGGAIYNAGNLTVSACVISNNSAGNSVMNADGGNGGAVYNVGTIAVRDSLIANNRAGFGASGASGYSGGYGWNGGSGGGIYSVGALFVANSTISNNVAGEGGGGGYAEVIAGVGGNGGGGGGIFGVTNFLFGCTVVNNRAGAGGRGGGSYHGTPNVGGHGGDGGGISAASLALTNCTIVGNSAGVGGEGGIKYVFPGVPLGMAQGGPGGNGGGIQCDGVTSPTVVSCTVAENRSGLGGFGGNPGYPSLGADGVGGGIVAITQTYGAVFNNIIARNAGLSPDVSGTFHSLGHNLIGITNGSGDFNAPGDLTGSSSAPLDPELAPLANNGGPTMTMALMSNSPAIDAGASFGISIVDQHGVLRPQGRRADIGAYEYEFAVPLITGAKFQSPSRFWIEACGMPNQIYALQISTNLTNWNDVIGIVTGSNGMGQVVDLDVNSAPVRFYRFKKTLP